ESGVLERDHQRQSLGWQGRAVVVGRPERDAPRRLVHLAGLVVATAEQRLGRLVVEEQVALRIDDEDRRREGAGELLGQDELHCLLRHAVSFLTRRIVPRVGSAPAAAAYASST